MSACWRLFGIWLSSPVTKLVGVVNHDGLHVEFGCVLRPRSSSRLNRIRLLSLTRTATRLSARVVQRNGTIGAPCHAAAAISFPRCRPDLVAASRSAASAAVCWRASPGGYSTLSPAPAHDGTSRAVQARGLGRRRVPTRGPTATSRSRAEPFGRVHHERPRPHVQRQPRDRIREGKALRRRPCPPPVSTSAVAPPVRHLDARRQGERIRTAEIVDAEHRAPRGGRRGRRGPRAPPSPLGPRAYAGPCSGSRPASRHP